MHPVHIIYDYFWTIARERITKNNRLNCKEKKYLLNEQEHVCIKSYADCCNLIIDLKQFVHVQFFSFLKNLFVGVLCTSYPKHKTNLLSIPLTNFRNVSFNIELNRCKKYDRTDSWTRGGYSLYITGTLPPVLTLVTLVYGFSIQIPHI